MPGTQFLLNTANKPVLPSTLEQETNPVDLVDWHSSSPVSSINAINMVPLDFSTTKQI